MWTTPIAQSLPPPVFTETALNCQKRMCVFFSFFPFFCVPPDPSDGETSRSGASAAHDTLTCARRLVSLGTRLGCVDRAGICLFFSSSSHGRSRLTDARRDHAYEYSALDHFCSFAPFNVTYLGIKRAQLGRKFEGNSSAATQKRALNPGVSMNAASLRVFVASTQQIVQYAFGSD